MMPGEHFGRIRGAISDVEVFEMLEIASLFQADSRVTPWAVARRWVWTKINECGFAIGV